MKDLDRRKYCPLLPLTTGLGIKTDEFTNVQQKTKVHKNAPERFSMNNWKKGDHQVMPEFPFTGTPGFKVEIPGDSDKLYFLKLFVDEEIIALLTLQNNKHASDFIQANDQKLGEHFGFSKWPKDVIKTYKMLALLLLHITWVS